MTVFKSGRRTRPASARESPAILRLGFACEGGPVLVRAVRVASDISCVSRVLDSAPRLRQECIATATTRSFLSEKTWALRWFMEFMGVAFVRSFFVHFVLQVKTPTRTATDAAGTPTGRCCLCLRAKVASKPKDAWGLLEACKYKCESMES